MTTNALFRSTSNVATVAKLAASSALSLSLVSFAQALGLPDIHVNGQGGLLDIVLPPHTKATAGYTSVSPIH